MAYPEGLEPPTSWSVAKCSIQLNYGYALEVFHLLVYHVGNDFATWFRWMIARSRRASRMPFVVHGITSFAFGRRRGS